MKLHEAKDYLINLNEMKTMTAEAMKDIDKAVSLAVDRLVTDEGLDEASATRFIMKKLDSVKLDLTRPHRHPETDRPNMYSNMSVPPIDYDDDK